MEFDALQAITNIRDAMLLDPDRDPVLLEDASGLLRWVAERVSSDCVRFDDEAPENETREERRKRLDKIRKRRSRHADIVRKTPGQKADNTRTESGQKADIRPVASRACAGSEIPSLFPNEPKEEEKTLNTPLPLSAKHPDRKRTTPGQKADTQADTDIVFEHWIRVMGKPAAKLTAGRTTKIRARLREGYTVEQLCRAVDGCRRSDYHMGANDSATLYNDLETILKSGSSVERHIARLAEPVRGAPPPSRGRTMSELTPEQQADLAAFRRAEGQAT